MSESKLKLSEEQRALNRERWNKIKTQNFEKKMLKFRGSYIKKANDPKPVKRISLEGTPAHNKFFASQVRKNAQKDLEVVE